MGGVSVGGGGVSTGGAEGGAGGGADGGGGSPVLPPTRLAEGVSLPLPVAAVTNPGPQRLSASSSRARLLPASVTA